MEERKWKVRLEYKLADFWIGVFPKKTPLFNLETMDSYNLDIWICLIPCFPIHITISNIVKYK